MFIKEEQCIILIHPFKHGRTFCGSCKIQRLHPFFFGLLRLTWVLVLVLVGISGDMLEYMVEIRMSSLTCLAISQGARRDDVEVEDGSG